MKAVILAGGFRSRVSEDYRHMSQADDGDWRSASEVGNG